MQEPLVKKYDIAMRVSLNQAKMGVYPSFFCLVILSERSLSGFQTQVQNHFSLKFCLLFHLKELLFVSFLFDGCLCGCFILGGVFGGGAASSYIKRQSKLVLFTTDRNRHVQLEVN